MSDLTIQEPTVGDRVKVRGYVLTREFADRHGTVIKTDDHQWMRICVQLDDEPTPLWFGPLELDIIVPHGVRP